MKQILLSVLMIFTSSLLQTQTSGIIQIQVNADKPITKVSETFNGTNI